MIQPQHELVWVKSADGQAYPFDQDRLAESIETAAQRLGTDHECLAYSIAASIHLYACEGSAQMTIEAGEIARLVISVLENLRYRDLATAYRQRHRQTEIQLDHIVAQSPSGFELEFFQQLDAALRPVGSETLAVIHLRGLRGCVMRLRGARRWHEGCRTLADEIVEHVRSRAAQLRPASFVALRLAVVE